MILKVVPVVIANMVWFTMVTYINVHRYMKKQEWNYYSQVKVLDATNLKGKIVKNKFIAFLERNQILKEYKEELFMANVKIGLLGTTEDTFNFLTQKMSESCSYEHALEDGFAFNYDECLSNIDWQGYDYLWKDEM